jgi:hypothetical protein
MPSPYAPILIIAGHLIYKCGGIDKRTIEKFEKVCSPSRSFHLHFHSESLPMIVIDYVLVGAGHKFRKAVKGSLPLTASYNSDINFDIGFDLAMFALSNSRNRIDDFFFVHWLCKHDLTRYYRKPPSWVRVPSSTHGSWTS